MQLLPWCVRGQAVHFTPENAIAQFGLAQLHLWKGDYAKALIPSRSSVAAVGTPRSSHPRAV